ncbi:hypothetical protein E4K62_11680 [Microbacterium wangchenii]|uniref:histidine kinase n=2 Tax=Microbacteriaceae TaxID=85023 RepID=A0ABX5SSY9_9MICO|nr:hypothetical protein E4K62_11680 [Microbacterium wangchenii]TXK10953.1 hypothetical protein FVP99_16750 [Microbacterium wangchenii]
MDAAPMLRTGRLPTPPPAASRGGPRSATRAGDAAAAIACDTADMTHMGAATSGLGRVRPDVLGSLALGVFLLPVTVAAVVQASDEPWVWTEPATIALFAGLHATSLLWSRRTRSALVAGSAIMLALAFLPLDATTTAAMLPSSLAYLLIVFGAARDPDAALGRAGLALGVAGALLIVAAHRVVVSAGPLHDDLLVDLLAFAGLTAAVVAVWAVGRLMRARDERASERAAEHVRDAIAAERRSISRDLHDIVAHSMTVMVAQAEAGIVAGRHDPAASTQALTRIADAGRESMRDMRALLNVLGEGGDAAALSPSPAIDDLTALVDGAAGPGRAISLIETGHRGRLARDAELAVHRTVQEALTNVVRHVRPPVRVQVALRWSPADLTLEIADDGGSGPLEPNRTGSGRGLIGMRERVTRAGGTLEIDRSPAWRVRARFPTMPVAG